MLDISVILIVVTVSWVFAYIQINQIVHSVLSSLCIKFTSIELFTKNKPPPMWLRTQVQLTIAGKEMHTYTHSVTG